MSRWKGDGQGVGTAAFPPGRCQVHKQNKDTTVIGCHERGLVLELPNTWRWLLQKVCGAPGRPVLVLQGEMPEGLAGPVQIEPQNAEVQASLSHLRTFKKIWTSQFSLRSLGFLHADNCRKHLASIPLPMTEASLPPAQGGSGTRGLRDGRWDGRLVGLWGSPLDVDGGNCVRPCGN